MGGIGGRNDLLNVPTARTDAEELAGLGQARGEGLCKISGADMAASAPSSVCGAYDALYVHPMTMASYCRE